MLAVSGIAFTELRAFYDANIVRSARRDWRRIGGEPCDRAAERVHGVHNAEVAPRMPALPGDGHTIATRPQCALGYAFEARAVQRYERIDSPRESAFGEQVSDTPKIPSLAFSTVA